MDDNKWKKKKSRNGLVISSRDGDEMGEEKEKERERERVRNFLLVRIISISWKTEISIELISVVLSPVEECELEWWEIFVARGYSNYIIVVFNLLLCLKSKVMIWDFVFLCENWTVTLCGTGIYIQQENKGNIKYQISLSGFGSRTTLGADILIYWYCYWELIYWYCY